MPLLITLKSNAATKIEQFKTHADAVKTMTDVVSMRREKSHSIYKAPETTYIVIENDVFELKTLVPGGKINIEPSYDADYPGVDMEYIPENNDEYPDESTRPRVLIEKPVKTSKLSVMVWADANNEDYSQKIEFTPVNN